MSPLPDDFAARVRAARGYAKQNRSAFGGTMGVSATTVKNWETGARPTSRAVSETVKLLSKASGLPEWFFTVPKISGMRAAAPETVEHRLAAIETSIAALRGVMREAVAEELELALLPQQPTTRRGADNPGVENR